MSTSLHFLLLESEDEGDRLWSTDVNVAHSLEDNTDDSVEEDSNLPPIVFNPLPFWYINPDGRQVLSKNQAAVTIDGRPIGCCFFVAFPS